MRKSKKNLGVVFMAAVLMTSCGGNIIEVASVEIQSTLSLEVGKTQTLTATVLPADATDKSVTWTSSNPSVASVTKGAVTAHVAGTATITAKAGDKTANCVVTVVVTDVNLAEQILNYGIYDGIDNEGDRVTAQFSQNVFNISYVDFPTIVIIGTWVVVDNKLFLSSFEDGNWNGIINQNGRELILSSSDMYVGYIITLTAK